MHVILTSPGSRDISFIARVVLEIAPFFRPQLCAGCTRSCPGNLIRLTDKNIVGPVRKLEHFLFCRSSQLVPILL